MTDSRNLPFHLQMQDEGRVQEIEAVLADIRDYALYGVQDSLHDAEYETAAADADVLAAVLKVEMFVLENTPTF